MSPRTEEQFEEIRETRKSIIKQAALELFATEGFHATPISMIAKKAGISKGLMYNYYESKEDLLKEIFREGIKKITDLIDPNKDGVLTRDEFRYMIDETFRMISQNRVFWSLYFSIIPQPGVLKIVKDEITEIYKDTYAVLMGYFKNAGYPEPETEAMIFGSMLDGISMNYLLNPDFYPLDKVRDRLIEIYC